MPGALLIPMIVAEACIILPDWTVSYLKTVHSGGIMQERRGALYTTMITSLISRLPIPGFTKTLPVKATEELLKTSVRKCTFHIAPSWIMRIADYMEAPSCIGVPQALLK